MKIRGNSLLKKIDRYAGIPIVFTLSLLRRKRKMPETINTLALLLTPAIGDTIVLQALLREIKNYNPSVKITLFCPKAVAETARLMQHSDEIIEINITNVFTAIKTLRKKKYDLLIDPGQWTRLSALICYFAKASHVRGFNTEGQFKHFAFDSSVIHNSGVHEVVNFKNLYWGSLPDSGLMPKIDLPQQTEVKKGRAVFHMKPGGANPHLKEWPAEYWKEIAAVLLNRNYEIYFTGSKADRPAIEEFIASVGSNRLINIAGELNITRTAEVLKSSSLVISVNTGIMHLASALGCPLIALNGPTNSKRWGPLNSNAVSIQSPYHQAPCLNLGFEYACSDRTGECMKAILPKMVVEAIESLSIDIK